MILIKKCFVMKVSARYNIFIIYIICGWLLCNNKLSAQGTSVNGLPFIQNFTPKEYDFHPQNWAITQDAHGLIFIANTGGLLEYDGVNWRKHELFENLTIVSLAIDSTGRLFVGGRGQFGFVQPDSGGRLIFSSLLKYLPQNKRNIRMVWETVATTHGVYFRTKNHLFRWDGQKLHILDSETAFSQIAAVRDTVYVLERRRGLHIWQGDSLRLLDDGQKLANKAVNAIVPFDKSSILLVTKSHGLMLYDGHHVRSFKTQADPFFRSNQLYYGIRLRGTLNRWALATTHGGLIIIDQKGKVLQYLNKKRGLPVDKVHYLFEDNQGALWASLNSGISRIELSGPFTLYDQRLGLDGTPHVVIRHAGTIYAGTNNGLFRFGLPGNNQRTPVFKEQVFQKVQAVKAQVWALQNVGDKLLVASGNGIFSISKKGTRLIAPLAVATYCFLVTSHENVYAGTRDGLIFLEKKNDTWQMRGKIKGISESIRTIVSDSSGNLWLGTAFQGLIKVDIKHTVTKFGPKQGLPGGMNYTYVANRHLRIGTYNGLYHPDKEQQKFLPDSSLGNFLMDSAITINRLLEDKSKHLWIMAGTRKSSLFHGIPAGNGYKWEVRPFRRLVDMNSLLEIYPDNNGDIWMVGRDEKIYRYKNNGKPYQPRPFSALVRRVSTIPANHLIWAGNSLKSTHMSSYSPELMFNNNSVRFEYAATFYDYPKANRYQIKLQGYDTNAHPWTLETRKDYTGLPAGSYVFHVKAQNIYGDLSRDAHFTLTILPPWYQRWWAYLIDSILLFLIIGLIVKIRLHHLEKKNRQLELLVKERTEIIHKQTQKLEELNKMKSRFFANIAHEFRTPLTLILGPVSDLLAHPSKQTDQNTLILIQRNAKRILQLINQLLDLARLESGKLKLKVVCSDLPGFTKGIVMSFASLAHQKDISLNYHIDDLILKNKRYDCYYFDRDIIEKIFYNLLSNAFKFSSAGDIVDITMKADDQNGIVRIQVKDSGMGIPINRLTSVFDRFYQVNSGNNREQQGTGIGLALTRELVELHHGRISVESELGHGTTFTVLLPVIAELFSGEEFGKTQNEAFNMSARDAMKAEFENTPGITKDNALIPVDDNIPVILVVDDHKDVREYICGHLQENYKVLQANNGLDGLNMAIETIPDMIISDVMMPKMDGYQLCSSLKDNEKTSHIPIILLTAKSGEKDKLSGLETGADDYLTKPFNSKELHIRVRNLIRMRHKLQQRFLREGMMIPRSLETPSVEDAYLQRLMRNVEDNLGDESFGVERLSQHMAMGRRQLHRKIKAITGKTPTEFIRIVRLQRARQFLENKEGTVSEIAYRTGFSSLSYFSKTFKEQFGVLPSEI